MEPDGKMPCGFHDLRRAFATMNADKLTPDALHLMQPQNYETTRRCINLARQMNPAVANLYVPDLKQKRLRVRFRLGRRSCMLRADVEVLLRGGDWIQYDIATMSKATNSAETQRFFSTPAKLTGGL